MIRLVQASPAHVGRIANRMREVDRRECGAWGHTGKEGLRLGLRASVIAATAFQNDRPIAMLGVTPLNALEGLGRPWFLGTDAVPACARDLMREGPAVIEAMHRRFRRLENWVSVENAPAIRMLERWGFELGDETMCARGVEFLPFWREAGV